MFAFSTNNLTPYYQKPNSLKKVRNYSIRTTSFRFKINSQLLATNEVFLSNNTPGKNYNYIIDKFEFRAENFKHISSLSSKLEISQKSYLRILSRFEQRISSNVKKRVPPLFSSKNKPYYVKSIEKFNHLVLSNKIKTKTIRSTTKNQPSLLSKWLQDFNSLSLSSKQKESCLSETLKSSRNYINLVDNFVYTAKHIQ